MREDRVLFSLEEAYPEEAGLLSYTREARAGAGFLLIDRIELSRPLPVSWTFMLRDEPVFTPGICLSGRLRLLFPAGLEGSVEVIRTEDARLSRSWPGRIFRLSLTSAAALRHEARFVMEGCDDA